MIIYLKIYRKKILAFFLFFVVVVALAVFVLVFGFVTPEVVDAHE